MLKNIATNQNAQSEREGDRGSRVLLQRKRGLDPPCGRSGPRQILERHSEPFSGPVHNATKFDPVEWVRSTRPRSAPPPVRELDEDGICQKFHWTRERWRPRRPAGSLRRKGAFGPGRNRWDEHSLTTGPQRSNR